MGRMAVTAVLIDLDGTLWDSAPWIASLVAAGDPDRERSLTEGLRNPSGGFRSASLLKARYSPARFAEECRTTGHLLSLYEGSQQVLKTLYERIPLGIVTSLPAWMVRPMLLATGLSETFVVVQGAQWGMPPKPHPAGLQRALSVLETSPVDALYVGDTEADEQAAMRAGVAFLWAEWGYDDVPVGATRLRSWYDLEEYA